MLNIRKNLNRWLMIAFLIILVGSLLNQAPTVSAIASIANLNKDTTATLVNKQLIPSDNGKIALITLKVDNQSSTQIDLIDYWARINGKSTSYTTQLAEQDNTKKVVLPGNAQYLTYYAHVSKNEELVDISVDVIKWDFSKSNYEAVLGNLIVSETNQPKVEEAVNIRYGDLNFSSVLENQFIYEDATNKIVSYRIKLSNEVNKVADISSLTSYAVINHTELYESDSISLSEQIDGKGTTYLYGQVSVPKETTIDAMSIALVDKKNEDLYPLVVFPVDSLIAESSKKLMDENIVHIGHHNYTVKGKGISLSSENKRVKINIPITIKNITATSGELSNVSFYLKTEQGLMYPMKTAEGMVQTLLPEIEEEITIEGFIPNEQAVVNSQLLIGLKLDSKNIVVKNLLLENIKIDDTVSSEEFVVDGQLVTLQRLSRIPNNDTDILVAEYDVKNVSKEAKNPIQLTGQFVLDGVDIDSKLTKTLRMNASLISQPNESERVVLYITVPFTQKVNDYAMKLTANEKSIYEHEMTLQGPNKILAQNEKYTTKTMGKKVEVSYHDSYVYHGTSEDLLVVQLEVKNKEKRSIIPSRLNGYIQTNANEIYQISFEEIKESLMPNGNKLITGSSSIPRLMSTKDLTIHFGEQLEGETVIYIDPVYVVHNSVPNVRTSLMEMITLNDKRFWVWNTSKSMLQSDGTNVDGIEINLDYQIDEVVGGIGQVGVRQLLIEYQDLTNSAMKITSVYDINNGTDLPVGRGNITLRYSNATIDYSNLVNGFNVNIYEVYKGYKRQLSSQHFNY